jgi:hypothetical protein
MALDRLQEMLGGSPQQQQDAADFLRRYQDDPGSISDAEAARRYREMMRNAPADMAADAHSSALDQLSAEERAKLADQYKQAHNDPNSPFDGYQHDDPSQAADPGNLGRMAHQAEQQDPDLFDKIFGQGSPLGSTLGKLAMAGVAAYMASRVLGGQNQQGGGFPAGGGLGGLFGGAGSNAPTPAPQAEPGLHVKGSKRS